MTDLEEAAARRDHVHRYSLRASAEHMTQKLYFRQFRKRRWFISRRALSEYEQAMRVLMCHRCLKEGEQGRITAVQFFVTFENDELQNFASLAHCTCHLCGYEEYIPMKYDPRKQAAIEAIKHDPKAYLQQLQQQQMQAQAQLQQTSGLQGMGAGNMLGGLGGLSNMLGGGAVPQPTANEIRQRHQEQDGWLRRFWKPY